jgi:hypothetical protein
MPALERALTLAQVYELATVIAEHLHLDVARVGDILLQHQSRIAKRLLRFARSGLQGGQQVGGTLDNTHTLTSPASRRFNEYWIA